MQEKIKGVNGKVGDKIVSPTRITHYTKGMEPFHELWVDATFEITHVDSDGLCTLTLIEFIQHKEVKLNQCHG